MEDSQLEQRIRLTQQIQEAWRDSGDRRSLVEILADHTFGMTRDELEDFMKSHLAPKLEQAWRDLDASKAREEASVWDLEREREARRKAEKACADKDAVIASKDKAIAAKDAEIEKPKKGNEDAMDTKSTDNRDRFGIPLSHAGARAACVIRSFTETCKQCGASIYEFFVTFFNGVAMGRTDYENRIEREQSQAVRLNYAERVAIPGRNMMPWSLVPNR